jgi:hypothetical protein
VLTFPPIKITERKTTYKTICKRNYRNASRFIALVRREIVTRKNLASFLIAPEVSNIGATVRDV